MRLRLVADDDVAGRDQLIADAGVVIEHDADRHARPGDPQALDDCSLRIAAAFRHGGAVEAEQKGGRLLDLQQAIDDRVGERGERGARDGPGRPGPGVQDRRERKARAAHDRCEARRRAIGRIASGHLVGSPEQCARRAGEVVEIGGLGRERVRLVPEPGNADGARHSPSQAESLRGTEAISFSV